MQIIVLKDKNGPSFFRTCCGALTHLRNEYYVHEDNPRLVAKADAILEAQDHAAALKLMCSRRAYEYEDFYTEELHD